MNLHDWPTASELGIEEPDDAYNAATALPRLPERYLREDETKTFDEEAQ